MYNARKIVGPAGVWSSLARGGVVLRIAGARRRGVSQGHSGGRGSRGGAHAAQHRVSFACARFRSNTTAATRVRCSKRSPRSIPIPPRRASAWASTRRFAAIIAGAERWLLDAARVDRQYEPRWTLANFYFRQQKMDDFWKWMRAALEVSYGDRVAAFDLCVGRSA